jgi:hypothetical protein
VASVEARGCQLAWAAGWPYIPVAAATAAQVQGGLPASIGWAFVRHRMCGGAQGFVSACCPLKVCGEHMARAGQGVVWLLVYSSELLLCFDQQRTGLLKRQVVCQEAFSSSVGRAAWRPVRICVVPAHNSCEPR